MPPKAGRRAGPEVITGGVTLRKGGPTSCLGSRLELALVAEGRVVAGKMAQRVGKQERWSVG